MELRASLRYVGKISELVDTMRRDVLTSLLVIGGIGLFVYTRSQASVSETAGDDGTQPQIDTGFSLHDLPLIGDLVSYKRGEYPKYASAIADAETRWDLPTDLVARVLYQESHYRADIINGEKRSPVGAIGIGQFMPDTAKQYGLIRLDGTDLRTDPFASIEATAHYLHDLYRMFGEWRSAVMAYNWGPGNVAKYNRGEKTTVPIETSTYVAQIEADVPTAFS